MKLDQKSKVKRTKKKEQKQEKDKWSDASVPFQGPELHYQLTSSVALSNSSSAACSSYPSCPVLGVY
jgi:hypothetical protein